MNRTLQYLPLVPVAFVIISYILFDYLGVIVIIALVVFSAIALILLNKYFEARIHSRS